MLHFEASGGLLNSSLVLQDKETDSYWSIMKGESISGEYEGTELQELPVIQKVRWADWRALHPDTLALSVNGREDVPVNPYESYLSSKDGFRGTQVEDQRLETKQAIFAFRLSQWQKAFAAPFQALVEGRFFQLEEFGVFLYRAEDSQISESTVAFKIEQGTVEKIDQNWVHTSSGAVFRPRSRDWDRRVGAISPLPGVDTFWYTWSPFHPDTEILR